METASGWRSQLLKIGLPVGAAIILVPIIFSPTLPTAAPTTPLAGKVEMHADSGADVKYSGPLQLEVLSKEKANEVPQYNMARIAAFAIKGSARDPDSVRFDQIRVSTDASVVCVNFGARNGFGGMNRESAVYVGRTGSRSAADWNKRCLGPMKDMTFAAP
jgi:hypothetical protein